MKLTAQVKLLPTPEQAEALRQTLEKANAACNHMSAWVWEQQTFRQYDIHKGCYAAVRAQTSLSAQVVVRCISKVADAYKLDRRTRREFRPHGSIPYDSRILRWYVSKREELPRAPSSKREFLALHDRRAVSLWTVAGRLTIPFVCGERQQALLASQKGESDLVFQAGDSRAPYREGTFFLLATCETPEPKPQETSGFLGVDLGVKNIAVDSDGEVFSGSTILNVRHRHRRLRTKLQKKQTKAAKRRLKKLSGKESRFARWVNHNIVRHLVDKAQCTKRGIALEELKGIRSRTKARKPQRSTLHSWAFHQLRLFLDYKARLVGVPLVLVDPRNTSRTCPECGCVDKRNRPSQSHFSCVQCRFAGLADAVAATNISRRGAVTHPNVSSPLATVPA